MSLTKNRHNLKQWPSFFASVMAFCASSLLGDWRVRARTLSPRHSGANHSDRRPRP
jgi:hypothetical protein